MPRIWKNCHTSARSLAAKDRELLLLKVAQFICMMSQCPNSFSHHVRISKNKSQPGLILTYRGV